MIRFLLLFLAIFTTSSGQACSCIDNPDFLTVTTQRQHLFVRGTLHATHSETLFRIKVDSVLNGDLELDSIWLVSGDGADCNVGLGPSDVGPNYLMVLTYQGGTDKQDLTFTLSECMTPWVEIVGDSIHGSLINEWWDRQTMALDDFYAFYRGDDSTAVYKLRDLETGDRFRINGRDQPVGRWRIRGAHGLVMAEGKFDRQGRQHGIWFYKMAKKRGEKYVYAVPKNTVRYHEGLPMEAVEYGDINGKQLDPGTLKNGNGTMKHYDDAGKLTSEVTYKDGIKEGPATVYTETGYEQGPYQSGEKHGIWTIYEEGKSPYPQNYTRGEPTPLRTD